MDLLRISGIHEHMSTEAKQYFSPIEIFPSIDSTNAYLLSHKPTVGAVCLAEQQTAGRGRLGKKWVSPPAQNIYLSVLCELDHHPAINSLSLVVGVAVIDALSKLGIQDLKIKWPNDIVYEGQKCAGILLEVAYSTPQKIGVVIGIGLNVHMRDENTIDQSWTSVAKLTDQCLSRNQITAYLLNDLYDQMRLFNRFQLTPILEKWSALDALYNCAIHFSQGSRVLTGIAKGINAQGFLQIMQGDALVAVSSGTVHQIRKDICG